MEQIWMDSEEGALLIAGRRNAGIFRSKGPARMGGIVGEIRRREGQLYRMYLRHVPLYERRQQLFAPELLICGEPDNIRDADSRQTRGAFRGLGHQLLSKRQKMTAKGFESRLQFLCQQKLSCLNFSMRIVPRSLRAHNLAGVKRFSLRLKNCVAINKEIRPAIKVRNANLNFLITRKKPLDIESARW